nr:hypothetical protein [Fischerella thermalis]
MFVSQPSLSAGIQKLE